VWVSVGKRIEMSLFRAPQIFAPFHLLTPLFANLKQSEYLIFFTQPSLAIPSSFRV
jgi:hypothetical protein